MSGRSSIQADGERRCSVAERGDSKQRPTSEVNPLLELQKKALAVAGSYSDTALSAAFIANRSFLLKFLTRFLDNRHDAEDVTQEAFLRAYMAEQSETIHQPKAFLFRVARNIALNRLTRKSDQLASYLEELGGWVVKDVGDSADREVEAEQTLGLYCEAVAQLPEKCRQVLLLRKVHGLTHREIAERLSLSLSSVEKYVRKGADQCTAYILKQEKPTGRRAPTQPAGAESYKDAR
jgi:RNA polymerase sigma-70 factor (ECF subfamily)